MIIIARPFVCLKLGRHIEGLVQTLNVGIADG